MQRRQQKHPHIAILPTALFKCEADAADHPYKASAHHGMYFIPYSDHSPYEELFTFISHLKPAEIYPIVNETKLGRSKLLSEGQLIKILSIIPESLYDLCCERKKITNYQNKELMMSCDMENPKALSSHMSSEVRLTKSISRSAIIQNKKLPKASEKKGVQFHSSSSSSDDDDNTSQIDEVDTTEIEREDVIIRTSRGKYTRVKIPRNIKNKISDVQVKLFDISSAWRGVADILSQLNTNRKTFLKNLSDSYNGEDLSKGRGGADGHEKSTYVSNGRTTPYTGMNAASEELDSGPSTYSNSVDNPHQEMSLSYAKYIKDVTVKLEKTDDIDDLSVCSASTVMAPQTKLLGNYKAEGNENTADIKQDCEVMGLTDSISVKEEDIHMHDIYSDDEHNLLSHITEDTMKNAIVRFPSDAVGETSESNNAPEETRIQFQSNPTGCRYRSRWNKSIQCRCSEQGTPHIQNTHEAVTKLSPKLTKRKRADTELINTSDRDSDSSTDSSILELNRTSKRKKCYMKENSMSTDIYHLSHPGCPNYTNGMDTSPAHGRKDEETPNKGCHDRLSVSIHSSHMSDYLGEPKMQLSDNKNQVRSSPSTYCKNRKANTIHAEKNRVMTVSNTRDGDVEDKRTPGTVACSRDITFNKETRIISEVCTAHSSEQPHQSVVSPALTVNEEDVASCNTTCNRMEIVTNTQSSELSFYTCTTSEQQLEVASTKFERILNLEGATDSVTGGSMDVICLSQNNPVISPPEQSKYDQPSLSADEKTQKFHGNYTEKKSVMSQTEQYFSRSPLFSNSHNIPQMDHQQREVGIQCELLSDRNLLGFRHNGVCSAPIENCVINDSANIPSENTAGIINLSQEIEMFTTESGATNSRQSNESEVTGVVKKKQSSPECTFELDKPPNVPNDGSSKSNTVTIDDTNADKSYNLDKRNYPKNAAPKNKGTFTRETVLQDNNYYGMDTTIQGMDQSAVNVIADKSDKNDSRNKRDVRNELHNNKELNRPLTSHNEGSQYRGSLKRKPSTNRMDRNYWTNGNRTPFAMVEVYLAAKNLSFPKGGTHKIGPLHHLNVSESSRNANDEAGNQQQNHTPTPVINLTYSMQQGKQLMAPFSTGLPDCSYKCNESKHKAVTEQRDVKCFNDAEEAHTISSKLRPVSASCVTEGSSGMVISHDILSNSDRGNNAKINDKTANSDSAIPLHLYTAGEPFTISSSFSFVSNTSTTCEETISDHRNVPKMTEETTDMLDESGVAPETSERPDDLRSGIKAILETSEKSHDMPGNNGVAPETPGRSDDLLGVNRVSPQTSQRSDQQLCENAVAPETQGLYLLGENDPDIVPDTPGENMITVQMYSCSKHKGVEGTPERKCEETVQIEKYGSLPKLCTSRKVDTAGSYCEHCIKESVLSEHKYCKTVESDNLRQTQNMYKCRFPTTAPMKETHNGPYATWCQIYLHRTGMSAEQSGTVMNFINTGPMVNKLSSTAGILDRSDICQNPYEVLLYLKDLKENELSNSSLLQIVKKKQTVLTDDSFAVNSSSRGNEEERKTSIPNEISSDDDPFPSYQVMQVTKTYGRTKRLQNTSKHFPQNSQNLATLKKYTSSETGSTQWKSYRIQEVVGKIKIKNPAAFKKQAQLNFMPTSGQLKIKHEHSNSK
ncbi:hypothetical protein B7P43_G00617 [Cryptotermes secundus]|uniref:DNA repair metallo-beta-lactamase domain-containing protein n=1 Tax=Cryptotermes secundus TaxID=105785 RepID=A0A2J7PUZ2_9NEOP|nr:hypothetical protein B7P43_G00617 [Cryptotermes secundus]